MGYCVPCAVILNVGDVVNSIRTAAASLLLTLVGLLAGCFLFEDAQPELNAVIAPALGNVPFTAQIVATAPPGTFTFVLPNATIEQPGNVLEVLVDSITWAATVRWTDGKTLLSTVVTAAGSNARPVIHRPVINGISNLWYLEPRERTLIDFSTYAATMTSPTRGVEYAGDWQLSSITLACSEKELCSQPIPDSIYYPPYADDAHHAIFNGSLYENACIVYPTSTYEQASNGRPYAPSPEEGYSYDAIQNRNVFLGISFPAQTAILEVVVKDDFGRHTSAQFEIPVGPVLYETSGGDTTSFDEAIYYIASKNATVFHTSDCYEVCHIPKDSRLYFADTRHAEESGRTRCHLCDGE